MYSPYTSISTGPGLSASTNIGFVVLLIASNLLAMRGFRALRAQRKGALRSLTIGLLIPVGLSATGFIQSMIFSVANAPRRYHYYYFAPSEPSYFQFIINSMLPNAMLPVMAHALSLVLLILGHAITSQSESD